MSERWVINQLFKVQAARIDWFAEKVRLHYEGPELQVHQDFAALQFRWLLHPFLGLPRQQFVLWHLPDQGPAGRSMQELANLPGWQPIETIGLPIDDSWNDTGYDLNMQGPRDAPLPPIEAALQRLQRGAPRIGWTRESLDGLALPDWQPSDLQAYLKDMFRSRLLQSIHTMLRERPNAVDHAAYVDTEQDLANTGRLKPHLLLNGATGLSDQDTATHSEWHPLGLLLLGAGSDPLVSLALGFGTAVNANPNDLYMVSVRHQLSVGALVLDFEIADVVIPNSHLQAPEPPANLAATIIGHNRPQVVDGPALETVGVAWDRALNPAFTLQAGNTAPAVSYVVGRFGPEMWRHEILLTRRPDWVGGWFPFVASKPDANEVRAVSFADHVVRSSTIGAQVVADPLRLECTYAVASQDIFGRWSNWNTVAFQGTNEAPQTPSIVAVQVDVAGAVTVDFCWDWSDRSPEFIELIGAYEDAPATHLFTARLQFGGQAQPTFAGFQVTPLDAQRMPIADWGPAQDSNPMEPEVRFYRLSTTLSDAPITFAGQRWRTVRVQGRGQCHAHQIIIPGWNVSPFGSPFSARVYDPLPPPPPAVPEAPQWASLPDVAGVSRALLNWPGDAGVAGYIVYEATETTLLAALGLDGPDTSQPFTDRLAVLRAANLPVLRDSFRRIQKELVPPGVPTTSFEVALPRGSTVMHFYAVTAMSHNQVESSWPTSSKGFIAVAAPRLAVPVAPSLEANTDPDAAQPVVNLRVGVGRGPTVGQVELYRVANEQLVASVDTMGAPIVLLPAAGPEVTFADTTLTPSWRRAWYRAVAWSTRDDLRGLVEARSLASVAVPVLLPPPTAPDVTDLKVNEPGSSDSETVISWTSKTPATITPLGSHHVVLVAHGAAADGIRLESLLDAVPIVNSLADLPPIKAGDSGMVRVGIQGNYRLYAWLPRPAADQPFNVTVKMIDPLRRIGSATAEVPVLPPLPAPQLSAITFSPVAILHGPTGLAARWEILSAVQGDALAHYTLRVEVVWPDNPDQPPLVIEETLDKVIELPGNFHFTLPEFAKLVNHMVRVQNTQQYGLLLRNIRPVQLAVTLTDPLNRMGTQQGSTV